MFTAEYEGINSFLIGASRLLLDKGVKRITRGYTCWELPEPFSFTIKNPTARWITVPLRKWNIYLAYAESLWLARGRNDLEFIQYYLKRFSDFSDDGKYLRGGYGPRLRFFNGAPTDYKINGFNHTELNGNEIDQYKYVIDCFAKDIQTRQAIINIGDPTKDCFSNDGKIKQTKDLPCTRLLHFMKDPISNKLNLTVFMRSNDFLWGATAVNIFNFTFIQEYFAHLLGLEIGVYYHISNNFHYYKDHREKIELLAKLEDVNDQGFAYSKSFKTLNHFDLLLKRLEEFEFSLRSNQQTSLINFNDAFFDDWSKILYHFTYRKPVEFINPILNLIINSKNG